MAPESAQTGTMTQNKYCLCCRLSIFAIALSSLVYNLLSIAVQFMQIQACTHIKLCGLLNWGEADLIPTWLTRKQRLAQVQVNQSINTHKSMSHQGKECAG